MRTFAICSGQAKLWSQTWWLELHISSRCSHNYGVNTNFTASAFVRTNQLPYAKVAVDRDNRCRWSLMIVSFIYHYWLAVDQTLCRPTLGRQPLSTEADRSTYNKVNKLVHVSSSWILNNISTSDLSQIFIQKTRDATTHAKTLSHQNGHHTQICNKQWPWSVCASRSQDKGTKSTLYLGQVSLCVISLNASNFRCIQSNHS